MMKKHYDKRKTLVLGMVAIILIAIALFFMPHKFVKDIDSIQFVRIFYLGEKLPEECVKTQKIADTLSSIWCRRRTYSYSPRSIEGDVIEINFMADGKPAYMVLGEDNFVYYSPDILHEYKIINSDEIFNEIMDTIQLNVVE
jgi:hypothetical protein